MTQITEEQRRCFRLRQRSGRDGKIIKHRDYVGLDRLLKHGTETFARYNWVSEYHYTINGELTSTRTYAELCEMRNNVWVKLSDVETDQLLNPTEDGK